jgi:ABC-2 type transport system permease protein
MRDAPSDGGAGASVQRGERVGRPAEAIANIATIAKKELRGYFGSAVAVIFLATFLAVTLFTVFWVEKFFARGVADLRPMFDWLPLLLILLVGALSMRLWSEEKKAGTLEILMTLPIPRWQLVAGKFVAGMLLIALALALTLGLPLTISRLGDLDHGPVIGGYFAALLLAAAYLAIGMCVSAVTDNQIVALVGTILVCAVAYLPGSGPVVDLVGRGWGEVLRHLGTGSRFASVARGVLDLRDIVYYAGLTVVFLGLNAWLLGRATAGAGKAARARRSAATVTIGLVAANVLLLNIWLAPISRARIDLTQHGEYSLSPTTTRILESLDEPLVIRGYFSEKTHPKLAPLVPRLLDALEEYRVAGDGNVRVEIVDPSGNDEAIKEAKERYSIDPTPLRFASRLEKGVINAYFTILVEYGNQHETLGFDELIEVKQLDIGELEVGLKNPEYDITRTIKKVVTGFQSLDAMFASLPGKAEITAYITPDRLPEDLKALATKLDAAVADLDKSSGGKLTYTKVEPKTDADMQSIYDQYGVRPFADLSSGSVYYFAVVLRVGNRAARITPPADEGQDSMKTSLVEGLKRVAPGFTKVVGLWTPPAPPPEPPQMQGMQPQQMPPPQNFDELRGALDATYEVRDVQLDDGRVPDEVEVLVLAGPVDLSPAAVTAVDQYVMRGGSLVVLAGHYRLAPSPMGIGIEKVATGLEAMLAKWGIALGDDLVLDMTADTFPVQGKRDLGDGTFDNALVPVAYPYFVRIDGDRVARDSVLTAGVPGAIMHWPVAVNAEAKLGKEPRKLTKLLSSTSGAWTTTSTDIEPDFRQFPGKGFGRPKDVAKDKIGAKVLAVAVMGGFPSSVAEDTAGAAGSGSGSGAGSGSGSGAGSGSDAGGSRLLVHSPADARVVVFGSSSFATDELVGLSRQLGSDLALSNIQLVQNAVDWAMADTDLLAIRARSSASRVLTVAESSRASWELVNYALAVLGLGLVIGVSWLRRQRVTPVELPKEVTS